MSETIQDRFGRTIEIARVGNFDVYAVSGLGWEASFSWPTGWPRAKAIDSIEAHVPHGWVEPPPDDGGMP